MNPAQGHAWERLEDQVGWYDRKSIANKRTFMWLKVLQLVAAAGVPVMASVHAAVWITGGLGATVVVVEGVQQLGQFQQNWVNYRSTCEALRHEKFLYLSGAGHYRRAGNPQRLLAASVESLVSREQARWTADRDELLSAEPPRSSTHSTQPGAGQPSS